MPCAWGSITWSSPAAAGFVPICSLLRSVRPQPLHWHEQRAPGATAPRWNPAHLPRKCHLQENQPPNSPSLSCDKSALLGAPTCGVSPLGKASMSVLWGDLPHQHPFREQPHEPPRSHTFEKPHAPTAELTHHRPFRSNNRPAKHSDYNSVLTATENTTN